MHNIYIYIIVAAVVTWAIRIVPLTLFRKPITSRFIKSFLYYVPYITLAVMTFPAIVQAAEHPLAGVLCMAVGLVLAWFGGNLPTCAASCCVVLLLAEYLMDKF